MSNEVAERGCCFKWGSLLTYLRPLRGGAQGVGKETEQKVCVCVCVTTDFILAHLLHMGWQGPEGWGKEMRHGGFKCRGVHMSECDQLSHGLKSDFSSVICGHMSACGYTFVMANMCWCACGCYSLLLCLHARNLLACCVHTCILV